MNNTSVQNKLQAMRQAMADKTAKLEEKYEKTGSIKINVSHSVLDEKGHYYVDLQGNFVGWKIGDDKIVITKGNNTDTLLIKNSWRHNNVGVYVLTCKRINRTAQLELI